MYKTPILFVIFNQPDSTRRVFEAIRKIQPTKLYIAADGPRLDKEGEVGACEAARRATDAVDWPCEVKRLYQENNLGGKVGPITAIDWFFDNEEEGIILEHDCLPSMDFFRFCEELLNKYRDVEKVKMISGDNFQFGKKYGEASYYFSRFPHIWGWATWRRSWKEYDGDMKTYPDFKSSGKIAKIFKNIKLQKYWLNHFDMLYEGKLDVWDGQVSYNIFDHDGVVILPNVNLVSNIGFCPEATHTKNPNDKFSNISTESLGDITHPTSLVVNEEADANHSSIFVKNIFVRILRKLKSILS